MKLTLSEYIFFFFFLFSNTYTQNLDFLKNERDAEIIINVVDALYNRFKQINHFFAVLPTINNQYHQSLSFILSRTRNPSIQLDKKTPQIDLSNFNSLVEKTANIYSLYAVQVNSIYEQETLSQEAFNHLDTFRTGLRSINDSAKKILNELLEKINREDDSIKNFFTEALNQCENGINHFLNLYAYHLYIKTDRLVNKWYTKQTQIEESILDALSSFWTEISKINERESLKYLNLLKTEAKKFHSFLPKYQIDQYNIIYKTDISILEN